MPSFDRHALLGMTNQSPLTNTGFGAAIQNGPVINDNKVRRIWRAFAQNNTGAPLNLALWAGDAGDPDRRLLLVVAVPANGVVDFPAQPDIEVPALMLRPQSQFAPTQENFISGANNGAADTDVQWFYHAYDLLG